MEKTETKEILPQDIKTIDCSKIKSIQLRDGKVLIINDSASSENQSELLSQARPLFTSMSNNQIQGQLESNQQILGSQECSRCHKLIKSPQIKNQRVEQVNIVESCQNDQIENVEQNQEKQGSQKFK